MNGVMVAGLLSLLVIERGLCRTKLGTLLLFTAAAASGAGATRPDPVMRSPSN